MTWSPIAKRDPVTIPLECSGGAASATFRPWSGRERLAYEDTMTTRLMTEDGEGETTIRLGTMRLVALTLTLEELTGFPDGYEHPTEEQLLELDSETLGELIRHSLKVQPLPGNDDEPETAEDGAADAPEGSADPDPSPTPPTPRAARKRAPRAPSPARA